MNLIFFCRTEKDSFTRVANFTLFFVFLLSRCSSNTPQWEVMVQQVDHGQLWAVKPGAAGFQLYSSRDCRIPAHSSKAMTTGVRMILPPQLSAMVTSHFLPFTSTTKAIETMVIDRSYRGEICPIIRNTNATDMEISEGEVVAQLVFLPYIKPTFTEVDCIPLIRPAD